MNAKVLVAALVVVTSGLVGCASGPKYTDIEDKFPPIPSGQGRVFFYRDNSFTGAAVKPDVKVDGIKVGKSTPGGFFFIDRSPGTHVVRIKTGEKYELELELRAAQTLYVRTKVAWGSWVGRVRPVLEGEELAMKTLRKAKYIGYLEELGGKPRKEDD